MDFAKFLQAYLFCALWSSTDDAGNPLNDEFDTDDISDELQQSSMEECRDFFDANADLLADALEEFGYEDHTAGNDFWLTRNGHGAGFWDRGLGIIGSKLTEAAKAYGSVDLYVGDDCRIYG